MNCESFCKSIWNLSYNQVSSSILKNDYQQFQLPKKAGTRTISYLPITSPLYALQKDLYIQFLKKQNLPTCVKGFKSGENYISYLEPHIVSSYFLRIDICNFFPSITTDAIKENFSHIISGETAEEKNRILELIADIVTLNGILPQGAPTSPQTSNIVMAKTDQRILKYCQTLNINYTRYADDMLFSSPSFNFNEQKWFLRKIKTILASQKFALNYNKIKHGYKEISLTGYVVSNQGIRLSRGRLYDIRQILSFSQLNYPLAKTAPSSFLEAANALPLRHRNLTLYPIKSIYQFTQYLCGYRSYLISFLQYNIDPSFSKIIVKLLSRIEKQILLYD